MGVQVLPQSAVKVLDTELGVCHLLPIVQHPRGLTFGRHDVGDFSLQESGNNVLSEFILTILKGHNTQHSGHMGKSFPS